MAGVRRVFAAAWTGDGDAATARCPTSWCTSGAGCRGSSATLRAVHADALADAGLAARGRPAVADLGGRRGAVGAGPVLAAAPRRPDADAARAFLRHLDALGVAVAGGGEPGPGPATLPGLPRTSAAAAHLATAVRAANRS